MPKVDIEVYQKVHGEHSTNVPSDVIEKGDQAIKDYLWKNSAIDQAIDYGEKDIQVNYIVTDR